MTGKERVTRSPEVPFPFSPSSYHIPKTETQKIGRRKWPYTKQLLFFEDTLLLFTVSQIKHYVSLIHIIGMVYGNFKLEYWFCYFTYGYFIVIFSEVLRIEFLKIPHCKQTW